MMLSNLSVNGQIHARNPKSLAEKDLPCQVYAKHAVMRFPFDIFIETVWVVSAVSLRVISGGLGFGDGDWVPADQVGEPGCIHWYLHSTIRVKL